MPQLLHRERRSQSLIGLSITPPGFARYAVPVLFAPIRSTAKENKIRAFSTIVSLLPGSYVEEKLNVDGYLGAENLICRGVLMSALTRQDTFSITA